MTQFVYLQSIRTYVCVCVGVCMSIKSDTEAAGRTYDQLYARIYVCAAGVKAGEGIYNFYCTSAPSALWRANFSVCSLLNFVLPSFTGRAASRNSYADNEVDQREKFCRCLPRYLLLTPSLARTLYFVFHIFYFSCKKIYFSATALAIEPYTALWQRKRKQKPPQTGIK